MTPVERAVAYALRKHDVHPSVVEDVLLALDLEDAQAKLFRSKAVSRGSSWYADSRAGREARILYIATGRVGQ